MHHLQSKMGEVSRLDWLRCFLWPEVPPEFKLCSPQTGGECSASVPMQEVDGEAFEGMSIWHGSPYGILELLVAAGGASAALQLIGWQRWGQQVAKVVVPHSGQLQVLQGRQSRSATIGFKRITTTMQNQTATRQVWTRLFQSVSKFGHTFSCVLFCYFHHCR